MGWEVTNTNNGHLKLYVGYLSGRKSPCLAVQDGSVLQTVAFFRNEEDMMLFWETFKKITRPMEIK